MRRMVIKLFDNRIFFLLVSLVSAFAIWLFVVNTVNPSREGTLTFDIQYVGEGTLGYHNLRLASDMPRTINLRVEASVADMGRLRQNPTLIVDLSGISEAGEHDVAYTLGAFNVLTGTVHHRPSDARLSNAENSIIVRVNRVTGRNIPLSTGGIRYELAEGESEDYYYVVRGESIETDVLLVDGPEEVLERIGLIQVVADFGAELSETTTLAGFLQVFDKEGAPIPFEELQDVTFSHEAAEDVTVHVTVLVGMAKRVPIVPHFEYGAGANAGNVHYRLSREYVWLIGDVDVLREVPQIDLSEIRLDRVELEDVLRRNIPLPPLAEIHGGPDYVDVYLEIRNISQREMVISSERVFFAGLAEEAEATVAIGSLNILIRGPEEELEELEEGDISVLVNLADYGGRFGRIPVRNIMIQIGDRDPEIVGAMDLFEIIVNIQRRSP